MFPDANRPPRTMVPLLLVSLLLHSASAEDIQPPPYNSRDQQVTLGQRIALGFFAFTTFGLTILVLYLRSEIARQTIRRLVGGLSAPLLRGGGGNVDGESTSTGTADYDEEHQHISPIGVELSDR
uniref:Transmembrane protein n=1 Tax=Minutocellus polymorphus TaxID=265543 RepID=A0A6U0K5J0_9STRA|mmetsp:Transcript_2886/g.4884  ORF Transcript_2886/g.4884 Transcript_2886/m.4884 type:complete len:125 (+) Transcript_2886:249-623(+)